MQEGCGVASAKLRLLIAPQIEKSRFVRIAQPLAGEPKDWLMCDPWLPFLVNSLGPLDFPSGFKEKRGILFCFAIGRPDPGALKRAFIAVEGRPRFGGAFRGLEPGMAEWGRSNCDEGAR